MRLGDPKWITDLCSALRGLGFIPLLGSILILAANGLDDATWATKRHFTLVNRSLPYIAIGFFLLIPLQTFAGNKILGEFKASNQFKIDQLRKSFSQLKSAETADELKSAISTIPGAPDISNVQITSPIPQVREQIAAQVQPQIAKLANDLDAKYHEFFQKGMMEWLRDGLVCFFYGYAFRALSSARLERQDLHLSEVECYVDETD